jgi:predicted nucleic acid-binding protein
VTALPTRAAVGTGALLALASSRDQYHARAVRTAERFRERGGRWVGSLFVIAELHGHLLKRLGPAPARRVVDAVLGDPIFDWRDAGAELVREATARWIDRFADQAFSMTDAVTFELMRRERINHAFAYDRHFTVAGYQLLA